MKKTILIIISLFMIVASVMITGCGPAEIKEPPDKVTVQLKWFHQVQFAGFYAADQKGFYKEEGIDATLLPSAYLELDTVIDDLLNGTTDFAIRGGDEVLTARADGKPIIAIAITFHINPWVYATLKESGIEKPQDFVGKKLMISLDGKIIHQAVMRQMEINPEDVELVPYVFTTEPLATGQVDVQQMYQPSLGQSYEMEGYELNYIWPNDYKVKFYADTIFTTEQMIEEKPEIVERFLRATLKGWRYAIENPDEAADFALKYDPTLEEEVQKSKMEAQIPLIHTGEAEIGWMVDSVWEGMHQMLLDGGILTQPINVTEAYTMEFLNKIYGKGE